MAGIKPAVTVGKVGGDAAMLQLNRKATAPEVTVGQVAGDAAMLQLNAMLQLSR